MNWQAMFTVVAIVCGVCMIFVALHWAETYAHSKRRTTKWLISLFLATLISAALAAGLSK